MRKLSPAPQRSAIGPLALPTVGFGDLGSLISSALSGLTGSLGLGGSSGGVSVPSGLPSGLPSLPPVPGVGGSGG